MQARQMLQPMKGGGDVPDIALPTDNLLAMWYAGNGAVDHASVAGDDGEPVTQWNDSSGSGYHVSQATEAAQPVYRRSVAALGGRGAVQFDGDDFLQRTLAAGITANLNVYTIAVVGIGNLEKYWYSENSSAGNTPHVIINLDGAGAANYAHRDDAATQQISNGAADISEAKHLIVAHRLASNSFATRVDGVEKDTSSTAPSTTTIDTVTLGALGRATPLQFLTGQIALVAVYGANTVATIEPIIAEHYGITLP